MTIHIKLDGNDVEVTSFQYPGGEIHLEAKGLYDGADQVMVTARLQEPQDILELMFLPEILDRYQIKSRHLIIPYFPYGRQDRVTARGSVFSLQPFSHLINSLGFNSVEIFDPHSDVTPALLVNNKVISQIDIIQNYLGLSQHVKKYITALVAPDSGAYKKASQVATHFQLPLVTALKTRNTATGEITGTRILDDVKGQDLLIVDDICDGGRTFTELAKELRLQGAASVDLYVTHGIFSKGYAPFKGLIDRIYTTNTFMSKSLPLPHEVTLFIHSIIR